MSEFEIRTPWPFAPERPDCKHCGGREGRLEARNGQDCVICIGCDKLAYNAPKTETGKERRSISTSRAGLKPKQRYRIIERANGACELCGVRGRHMQVDHLLSLDDAHSDLLAKLELTDRELNDTDDNLAAMCEECNAGKGNMSIPPRLFVALLLARTKPHVR